MLVNVWTNQWVVERRGVRGNISDECNLSPKRREHPISVGFTLGVNSNDSL